MICLIVYLVGFIISLFYFLNISAKNDACTWAYIDNAILYDFFWALIWPLSLLFTIGKEFYLSRRKYYKEKK